MLSEKAWMSMAFSFLVLTVTFALVGAVEGKVITLYRVLSCGGRVQCMTFNMSRNLDMLLNEYKSVHNCLTIVDNERQWWPEALHLHNDGE